MSNGLPPTRSSRRLRRGDLLNALDAARATCPEHRAALTVLRLVTAELDDNIIRVAHQLYEEQQQELH